MRFEIRVKPNAKGSWVGGTWGDTDALNVHVAEKAIDGRANDAAREVLSGALRIRKRQISIVSGHKHRTKVIEIADPPDGTAERLQHWRNK